MITMLNSRFVNNSGLVERCVEKSYFRNPHIIYIPNNHFLGELETHQKTRFFGKNVKGPREKKKFFAQNCSKTCFFKFFGQFENKFFFGFGWPEKSPFSSSGVCVDFGRKKMVSTPIH